MSRPWMKFYPRDWRADPRLRMCSLAARGLWIELIGYMHEAEPYGHLLIDGKRPSAEDLAALIGRPVSETRKALLELGARGVYSVADDDTIYSRRMVRDNDRSEEGLKHIGKRWPKRSPDREPSRDPNRSPTGEPITQKPDTREQSPERTERKKDAADAAPDQVLRADDHKSQLFRRGRELLGEKGGGLITKLLQAKNKNVALARAALEMASTKENPREYLAAITNGGAKDEANEPAFVRKFREGGYPVERRAAGGWRCGGSIYNDAGEQVGW